MALSVGVIGGGQLARMMIVPAVSMGVELSVFAEAPGSSARLAATVVGDYRNSDEVLAFARTVDAVTFDHEHVPQSVLRQLIDEGVRVHPGPDALLFAQDKLEMRRRLTELGVPVPVWAAVKDAAEVDAFLADNGGVAVVKTPRGGYDGRGVRVVRAGHEVIDWFETPGVGFLLIEELVGFSRELSQMVARSASGEVAVWPLVESVQRDGVCAEVIAPAPRSVGRVAEVAEQIARTVAEGVGVTGVLAVELFETDDGRLLVNELAMRPHNTGHWTIEGAVTSQFEQHLRAVLDLPLGDPSARQPWTVMSNILGGPPHEDLTDRYPQMMSQFPAVKVHGYGKETRPGRKVGHVTVSGTDLEDVVVQARAATAVFD